MTEWVQETIVGGGVLILFLFVFAENLFPPIPSELVLPLAGFLVADGEISFVTAMIAATAGSLLGALVLYGLGRLGGRPLLLRYKRWLHLTEERIEWSEAWFSRWGPAVVFFGRMIPAVRSVISIPAGLTRMDIVPFLLLTALGSALWNAALIGAGWALDENWEKATDAVGGATPFVLVAIVLVLVAGAVVVWRRSRGSGPDRTPSSADAPVDSGGDPS